MKREAEDSARITLMKIQSFRKAEKLQLLNTLHHLQLCCILLYTALKMQQLVNRYSTCKKSAFPTSTFWLLVNEALETG